MHSLYAHLAGSGGCGCGGVVLVAVLLLVFVRCRGCLHSRFNGFFSAVRNEVFTEMKTNHPENKVVHPPPSCENKLVISSGGEGG